MNIKIPITLEYENTFIKLEKPKLNISLVLKNGVNLLTTNPIESGVAKYINGNSKKLYTTISFKYDYNKADSRLTIISNDYHSSDSLNLIIGHPGYPQITTLYRKNDSLNSSKDSFEISIESSLLPGLKSIIDVERLKMKKSIINEANKNGVNVFVKSPLPKMKVDDYLELSSVYDHNGKFVELFDNQKVYSSSKTIFHIESFHKGNVYFAKNQKFANVIGSTHDPQVGGKSWLRLWRESFNATSKICASFGFNEFDCTNGSNNGKHLVGGHVIFGDKAREVKTGSDEVYIIPICKGHNNNNNVYMLPIHEKKAVWLGGFMQDFNA